jgi:hypothetical protein
VVSQSVIRRLRLYLSLSNNGVEVVALLHAAADVEFLTAPPTSSSCLESERIS